uniref:Centrosomal protein 112 n=1 Tax=Seriola lalandi dorsalis TaxID=1841481 RepID=A0A3B4YPC4_SERLL
MSKREDSWEKLETEFDHFLLDMKPHVLKHPNKTERQQCAIWIKKLCDPATCGSGLIGRKNRNMYARLLLHMLKRGVLEGPFTSKPEPGSLKTLPAYMSIYFDEPLSGRSVQHSNAGLPDWVTGELGGYTDDSLTVGLLKDRTSSTPIATHHRYFSTVHHLGQIYTVKSFNKDILIRTIIMYILDRKNGEIEEMKSMYRAKQKESEEMIRKLEKKVQSVLRESQVICESKEKQIAELKKMSDQSADSLKNEWEKRLHAAVTEMEQEKFELQKKHTENIQELLEDTNRRLAKMEAEYNARSQVTEQTVGELELRVKQQSVEVEKGNALRQKVTQEKAQLEIQIASISAELQEANRRSVTQCEQYEHTVQKLQAKHETDMSHLHQEHVLSATKASEVIEDYEKTAAHLKQQLQDSEHRRHQQLRDQEIKFQQEKDELQINCEKKVRTRLQQQHSTEKDSLVQERQREVSSLERQARAALQQHQQHTQEWRKRDAQTISDMEVQLSSLREEFQGAHTQHKQQLAELAFLREEEKQRAFLDKEASLDRLRSDMERIRSDLERSHQHEKDAAQEKVGQHSLLMHLIKCVFG